MSNLVIRDALNEIKECRLKLEKLKEKISSYTEIKMYLIKQNNHTVLIPCESCLEFGEVRDYCNKCGGKGVYKKTKQKWEVMKQLEEIEEITFSDYGSKYWTDYCSYWEEESKRVFFTIEEAQIECDKRNKLLI